MSVEGEADIDGEAPVGTDETSLDCDEEGNCYECACAPGFTGVKCSEILDTGKCRHAVAH